MNELSLEEKNRRNTHSRVFVIVYLSSLTHREEEGGGGGDAEGSPPPRVKPPKTKVELKPTETEETARVATGA